MSIFPKVLNDTVPNEFVQKVSLTQNGSMCLGILVSGVVGSLLKSPEDASAAELQENTNWRYMYVFNIVVNLILIAVIVVFYPNPSIKDAMKRNNEQIADALIEKIYRPENESVFL